MTTPETLRTSSGLIPLHEAAALLGSHPQTLYKNCRTGKMPHIRIGARIKFDPHVLAAFIEQRSVGQRIAGLRPPQLTEQVLRDPAAIGGR